MSQLEERARALHVPGEVGYRKVAKQLRVRPSRVRAILFPETQARSNEASRLAKQRRQGVCEICGKPTRYSGKNAGVSRICAACNVARLNSPEAIARRTRYTRESLIEAIQRWHSLHGDFPTIRQWSRGDREWPSARAVQHRFGSWNAGIAAAGFTPREKGVM